jgi:Protein of unknown function (DUF3775)
MRYGSGIYRYLAIATLGALLLQGCAAKSMADKEKPAPVAIVPIGINGVTFEAPPQVCDSSTFVPMQRINAGWVALVPFGFCRPDNPQVMFNSTRQWWGEKDEGIIGCTQLLKKQGMQIMLKPQIWIGRGTFTGDYDAGSEEAWQQWEKGYSDYILHNAQLADSLGIELFCLGTELEFAVTHRSAYWLELIQAIRKVYKGKLTYAANWNEFEKVSFWPQLDYIGIDAYFPLSEAATPSVNELVKAWQKSFSAIEKVQATAKKPVLFTEYGYRSTDYCAKEPWVHGRDGTVNTAAQANALEALYRRFAPEPWFAGGFIWKWHANDARINGEKNSDYTPQHKPAESVIQQWYQQKNNGVQ